MHDNPFEASEVDGTLPALPYSELVIRESTGLGATFQESFRLWRALFWPMLLTVLVVTIPMSLMQTWTAYQGWELQNEFRAQQILDGIANFIQLGAIGTLLYRANIEVRTTPAQALSGGLAAFVPLMILNIPVSLGLVCGLLLFIVPGIYVGTRLCLTHVVYLLEPGDGLGNALRRSWDLTRPRFWQTLGVAASSFGVVMVVLLPYMGLMAATAFMPQTVFDLGIEMGMEVSETPLIVADYVLVGIIDVVFAYPLMFTWFPLFVYFDAIRRESAFNEP